MKFTVKGSHGSIEVEEIERHGAWVVHRPVGSGEGITVSGECGLMLCHTARLEVAQALARGAFEACPDGKWEVRPDVTEKLNRLVRIANAESGEVRDSDVKACALELWADFVNMNAKVDEAEAEVSAAEDALSAAEGRAARARVARDVVAGKISARVAEYLKGGNHG